MSKNDKTPTAEGRGQRTAAWTKSQFTKLTPVIDWTLKGVATVFVLATSFCFVRNWLQENRLNHDFSLAGAILVMSIALYLIVRKR